MNRFGSLSRPTVSRILSRGFKKTIEQLHKQNPNLLKDAKVLVRVDFNVPLSKSDSTKITDDTRIREALPTINFLRDKGSKVVLISHCGRPDGKVNEKMRMAPMAKRLSELINAPVKTTKDCIGSEVDEVVSSLVSGEVLMLENARFYKEEEKNSPEFAEKLSKHATVYVNDAFGTAHRAHASTQGVCKHMQHRVAGYLMEKELKFLQSAVLDAPKRPLAAIIGGAKVSTKVPVIKSLIEKCDKIILGGGMIFTFYRAQGLSVGKSLVEEEYIPLANELLTLAKNKGVEICLPNDIVIAKEFKADSPPLIVDSTAIPDDFMGLDIGPKSVAHFSRVLESCNTIVWNGPMGVFEFPEFAKGTFAIAKTLADATSQRGAVTVVGGGDSVAAVTACRLHDKMSHLSTGGGASLELLEGQLLPGVEALDDA